MQRDMKIGMALGLALVGIVGALFFRREPEVKDKDTPPPLQNAEELDREIAGRAKAPYIKGLEEFDGAAAPVPAPAGPENNPANKPANKADEPKPRDPANRKPAAAPEPIQPGRSNSLANDQIPAHNRDWDPVGPSGSSGKKAGDSQKGDGPRGENQRPGPAGNNVGTNRTHVIQPGETLSALASRYLGSSGRYNEIYEANKNVLRSPNDVREGLTIVIPDAKPTGASSPASNSPAKPRDGQHVADGAGSAAGTGGNAGTGSGTGSGTRAQRASARTVKQDGGKSDGGKSDAAKPAQDDSEPAAEPTNDRPRERIRFVPVPRGPFSAGRTASPGTSMKSETRKGASAIDDSPEGE